MSDSDAAEAKPAPDTTAPDTLLHDTARLQGGAAYPQQPRRGRARGAGQAGGGGEEAAEEGAEEEEGERPAVLQLQDMRLGERAVYRTISAEAAAQRKAVQARRRAALALAPAPSGRVATWHPQPVTRPP